MIKARIEPIQRDVQILISRSLSPEAQSAALAAFANKGLADAQTSNERALGYLPTHETYVDGMKGAKPEMVRPDGTIVFEFDLINDIFEWIGTALVRAAPIKTGRYQDSFIFLAGGMEVDPGADVPPADEYFFINTQPYSRKIERGLSDQAPDGVFEVVAAMAASRFGNIARVRFGFRSLLGGYIAGGANRAERQALKSQPARLSAMRMERESRQPAIIITLR